MATTREMLEKILNDLKNVGDIEASAVVSRDGLLMASNITGSIRAETFAAMSATMLGAAETATSELKKGIPDRVVVESKEGKVIAAGAGPKALLVAMARPEAGLGLALVEMEKAAEKIKQILG
ncbi:MAG: roadblock/LC7 domain-containing protein [Euryarchaeota archaeon]|nr:roadblock/LC7 domain-containing protein [Euryarchaeota archaeon]